MFNESTTAPFLKAKQTNKYNKTYNSLTEKKRKMSSGISVYIVPSQAERTTKLLCWKHDR